MRKKKQISLRIEWIETIATLITSLQLEVMNAVIAYLTDGTVTKIDNIDAAEMFRSIKNDIDARAEERRRKAAERRAKKAPVPGYLPEKAPENLDERVAAENSCGDKRPFRQSCRRPCGKYLCDPRKMVCLSGSLHGRQGQKKAAAPQ